MATKKRATKKRRASGGLNVYQRTIKADKSYKAARKALAKASSRARMAYKKAVSKAKKAAKKTRR